MNNIRQLTKDEYPKAIELSWQVFTITGKEDSVDRAEAHAYRQQETARARSIIEKLDAKFAEFDAPEYEQLELDL